jgi:hypothetical protein
LPIRFSDFWKKFLEKILKILKMTMSCTPTRTKNM